MRRRDGALALGGFAWVGDHQPLHRGCTGLGRGVLGQSWLWPRAQAGGHQDSSWWSSPQNHKGIALLSREPLLRPSPSSSGSLCIRKAPGEFSRVHLKIQTMHPFNPFREPVR